MKWTGTAIAAKLLSDTMHAQRRFVEDLSDTQV